MNSPEQRGLPKAPLPLIPVLYFPRDGGYEATSDSTFQIRRLESAFEGRSVVPSDPAVAFLDYLVEDFADEWVTKMMFHYRWAIPENVDNACRMLPRWTLGVPESFAAGFREGFGQRQIDRLAVVGSNEVTGPVIERSYRALLEGLERHLQASHFVMGARPGTADFALFGQLSQLVQVEPTSQALAREIAPRVVAWCDLVEDQSGLEVDETGWMTRDEVPATFRALLELVGRYYAPFLVANAEAVEQDAAEVRCTVDGAEWVQTPFRYQAKCLAWLREAWDALSAADRNALTPLLTESGCDPIVRA
jgi:glutathione S-transferase